LCAFNYKFQQHLIWKFTTYSWDFGNGQTSNLQNPGDVTYLAGYIADTTYYIVLSVSNFCGTVTATDSVIVMPTPVAIFGPLFDVGCSPYVATFANNSVGLPDNYFWDFGNGNTSTDPNALVDHVFTTGLEPSEYTITLTVSNECGSNTSEHTITVLPNQVNAFFNTPNTSGCAPYTVTFTQFSTGANTFVWDFGDGNTSNILSPTHTFQQPGTYTVTLAINDGCSFDTSSVEITVNPSPFVDFTSSPDSVCINVPFDFTNLSVGLAGSSWNFGDGNTSVLVNPSHSFTSPGTYNVTLTGTSAINGCTSSITKPVVVSPNPTASFTANPISGCMPLTVSFANTSINGNYIVWDFGDGNSSTNQTPTHTFTDAGNYAVKLLVENTSGCKDSVIQVITVHPLPVASFTMSTTDVCYAPVTANFTNQSTGAVNYNWNFGNAQFSTLTNPTIVYDNPGTYTISLTVENQYGCTDQTQTTFTIYPTPIAQFTISDNQVCVGDSVVFTSQSLFADSLVWYLGDGSIMYGNTVTYAYNTNGIFDVTLVIFGAGGCSDTLEFPNGVEVFLTPIAGFDYVNIQNPDPLSGTVEFTNTSINADTYLWLFGNGNTSEEINPIERYNQYGDFVATLIASNQYGCADTITQIILVDFFSGLFVPNAVYPGHSSFGVNHFLPKGVGLKTYEILIYDDWGNLIWESTSLDADGRPNEAWDATFRGEPVQQDAYVWKVTATFLDSRLWEGKEYAKGVFKKSGTVTVIK
jgi:large repetitive protein